MLYNGYRKEGQVNKANDKRDTLIYSKKKPIIDSRNRVWCL